jgi:UDP-N-acetylglucosamine 4,6-dehydratase/5-epimerase
MFKNKIIFIDGGSGSWGNALTERILQENPKEIRIYSRGEFLQVTMARKFNNPKIKFIIGDVRDYQALNKATKNVDYLFHLSALKHVPVCEENVEEAIKTNILGTQNVIDVAINNNIKSVIDVSTDKACNPVSLYGYTKAVGEKLIQQAHAVGSKAQFLVIRGGNALGSSGSVVPFFIDQIRRFNAVTITDSEMTRYFMTLPDAIELLFVCTSSELSGALLVIKMSACKIIDLARILIKYYGNKTTKIKIIGLRPGEKIHETLVSKEESVNCYDYKDKYYLVYPYNKLELPKVAFKEYASNDNLMHDLEIEEMLRKGGFIR